MDAVSGTDSPMSSPLPATKKMKTELIPSRTWGIQTDAARIRRGVFYNAHKNHIVWATETADDTIQTLDSARRLKTWRYARDKHTLEFVSDREEHYCVNTNMCSGGADYCCTHTLASRNHYIEHITRCNFVIIRPSKDDILCHHDDSVNCIATNNYARLIFSGTADGKVKIWNYDGVELLEIDDMRTGVQGILVSKDGSRLFCWCRDARDIHYFDITDHSLAEKFALLACARAYPGDSMLADAVIPRDMFNLILAEANKEFDARIK